MTEIVVGVHKIGVVEVQEGGVRVEEMKEGGVKTQVFTHATVGIGQG